MKKLICEMCASHDLVKQEGLFVCQSCGCKYSLEEAKRLMIEGTVDVKGTVKIDETKKIDNYYIVAENAYEANNKKEAEKYCNKIIEIDSNNPKAWFLKGKAAGWQSTLRNVRIEESVNCFNKAIEKSPEDEVEGIKQEAASEISLLSISLMRVCCENFAKNPSNDNEEDIHNYLNMAKRYSSLFLVKCGVQPHEFYKEVARLMNQAVCDAWKDVITKEYQHEDYPGEYKWKQFKYRALSCLAILSEAINLSDNDDQEDIQRYKNMIHIRTEINASCSYTFTNGNYRRYCLPVDVQKENIDLIMKYHEKIKEINPSYLIPSRPNTRGGCYVATAVYGSYDCPQVWTLRRFRDNTLAETWYGRAFIYTYYAISPTLVRWFGHTDWFKKMWKRKLDRMVSKLNAKGVEDTPYKDKNW